MNKIRYEIDPYNKFIVTGSDKKSGLPEFRKVADGSFKLDENNELSYHLKAPYAQDEDMPRQIKIKGSWSLTKDHNLRVTLDASARETFGDQITLEGEILDVNKNSLLFAVTTTTKDGVQSNYVLNLYGRWRADADNRISFHVRRESGRFDILFFSGAWELGDNYQIVYQYEKASLVRKKRESRVLAFKGFWDIKDAFRISYLLAGDSDFSLDFKASASVFKDDYIKYELGMGLSVDQTPAKRTITLFGRWNVKKDSCLTFEVKCQNNKINGIEFGAQARLTDSETVSFKLKDSISDKDMGITLELSRKMLAGDGEAFIRFLKSNKESAVYLGAACRW